MHKSPSLCLGWIKAIVSIIGVSLTTWSYTDLLPNTAQSFLITRASITYRAEEKTGTILCLHWKRFFTQKYWHFQFYRELCKSNPLLAEAFTAMGSRADILACCCFSPAADGGLLCCSYSRHAVIFFFATTKTTIPKLLLLKLLLLETTVALPLNQVPPLLM